MALGLILRDKDDDEGIPSETEEDKRQLETKAKEMRGEEQCWVCRSVCSLSRVLDSKCSISD